MGDIKYKYQIDTTQMEQALLELQEISNKYDIPLESNGGNITLDLSKLLRIDTLYRLNN